MQSEIWNYFDYLFSKYAEKEGKLINTTSILSLDIFTVPVANNIFNIYVCVCKYTVGLYLQNHYYNTQFGVCLQCKGK